MRLQVCIALCVAPLVSGTCTHAGSSQPIEVSMQQFTFAPAAVTVPAGATVTWINRDTVPHSVTSSDGGFDSGPIEPGKTFEWAAGKSVTYHCVYHPSMTGAIQVTPAP